MRPGTNTQGRGNSEDRRRRKLWLIATYGVEGIVTRYFCDVPMLFEDVTSDRIVPGCQGGTYRRDNIRPACFFCNVDLGSGLRGTVAEERPDDAPTVLCGSRC